MNGRVPVLNMRHSRTLATYARLVTRSQTSSRAVPLARVACRPGLAGSQILMASPGNYIQKRFLLGPFFRLARTGVAIGAGAVTGGAAYVNYKVNQAGASVSDSIEQAKDWVGGVWDKVSKIGSGLGAAGGAAGAEGTGGGNSGGEGAGGSSGSSGSSGSGGGGGSDAGSGAVVAAVTAFSSNSGDSSSQEDQMINLTRKMIDIRNILLQVNDAATLAMPSIVVIGSQSSGKTSVLEALVGHEFLPKGGNLVTRRPVELTLVSSPDVAAEYAEFPALKLGKITDFRQVQRTIAELNLAVPEDEVVSDEPIQLKIYSPHVPDLTMIDLPGYIQVIAADQPVTLKNRIIELADKYIQEPNIILAVSAADVDLANSTALKESRRVDPHGHRTIGVITKLDLVDPLRGEEILENRMYPLKMGYVGVITRPVDRGLFGSNANMTGVIARNEQEYFKQHPQFQNLQVGVLDLRRKLMTVLEKSMAQSLHPTTRAIRRELDESSYQFKVEYNDRVLTPNTYLAQSLDSFKQAFKELSSQFTRDDVKYLIKNSLDQKVLDLLAEWYWNSPDQDAPEPMVALNNLTSSRPETAYWQGKLDQTTAALTKLGIGRMSAKALIDEIEKRMKLLVSETSFKYHPTAAKAVEDATKRILDDRYYATTEQVENATKPYKYEVEVDDREWASSREHAYNLLKEELRQCQAKYDQIKQVTGANKLSQVMNYVEQFHKGSLIDHLDFSPLLLQKGREALFLRKRSDILQMRMAAVKSKRCVSRGNRALCPEVFFDVVADKLTSTAVLFLNFELLSDFYYSFPRELDSHFAGLNEHEIEAFAGEDPRVKQHVELQRRKALLQLALRKIQAVTEMQSGRN